MVATFVTPQNLTITLETREVVAEIEPGSTYKYWTFNGTIPVPLIRVVTNDTIEIRIVNLSNSQNRDSRFGMFSAFGIENLWEAFSTFWCELLRQTYRLLPRLRSILSLLRSLD